MRELKLDGPIPGENYTSDTKNYPWHRPPEFTDLDKAIEMTAKRLTSEENALNVLGAIEAGISIASLTEIYLMSGIGAGKWTTDQALLLAGPVSHILILMAKGYGVEYDMGTDTGKTPITGAFYAAQRKMDKDKAKKAAEETMEQVNDVQEQASGFGASPPDMDIDVEQEDFELEEDQLS